MILAISNLPFQWWRLPHQCAYWETRFVKGIFTKKLVYQTLKNTFGFTVYQWFSSVKIIHFVPTDLGPIWKPEIRPTGKILCIDSFQIRPEEKRLYAQAYLALMTRSRPSGRNDFVRGLFSLYLHYIKNNTNSNVKFRPLFWNFPTFSQIENKIAVIFCALLRLLI